MAISSWLSWPISRSHARRGQRPDRASRSRKARFSLEPLEGRALLTSYTAAGVSDLIADITAANTNGGANTITLTAAPTAPYDLTAVNNTTVGATGLPVIAANDNLTIVGSGDTVERSTVSGTAAFRLFDVATGGSLTLQSLTLEGGLAFGSGVSAEGGAIDNQGSLTLNDVTVENNIAQGAGATSTAGQNAEGGAIYSSGLLTLSGGTTVENNSALDGSGTPGKSLAAGSGYGGALYVASSTVNVTNAILSSNTAAGGNGGNQIKGLLTGAIGPGGNGYGSALYAAGGTVTLTSDNVSSNEAKGGQGGSRVPGGSISSSNQPGGSGSGGALYASAGTVYVNSSTLQSDIAQGGGGGGLAGFNGASGGNGYGGAIVIGSATVSMSGDTLSSNTAQGGNGGAGVNFGNGGNGLGGGIYQSTLGTKLVSVLTNTTLSSNIAQGGSPSGGVAGGVGGNGLGGAIYVGSGSIEIDMSAVSSNLAQGGTPSGLGEGGGFYIAPGTSVKIAGVTLSSNHAQGGALNGAGEGGGIFIEPAILGYVTAGEDGFTSVSPGNSGRNTLTTVEISSDTFSSNVAQGGASAGVGEGGAIYIGAVTSDSGDGTDVSLSGDTLSLNTAQGGALGEGGGLFIGTEASAFYGSSVASVYIDAFTLANVIDNTASTSYANIFGTYIET